MEATLSVAAPKRLLLNYRAALSVVGSLSLAIASYLKTPESVRHAVPPPLKPGEDVTGSVPGFPPPSAWDAPRDGTAGAKH